jgi:hypothetical protein
MVPTPVTLADWPYDSLNLILFAEAAAAFEELTSSGQADQLKVQVPDAWPNLFREARFLSAVDFVQADRLRRKVAGEMARAMSQVDFLLVPSLRDEMLVISNNTGHPSLTLRTGFVQVAEARSDWAPDPAHPLPKFSPPRRVPHGVTLIGQLFDEGTIARAGLALERSLGVVGDGPRVISRGPGKGAGATGERLCLSPVPCPRVPSPVPRAPCPVPRAPCPVSRSPCRLPFPRSPFPVPSPVPRSPFPVPRPPFPVPVPRSPFPVPFHRRRISPTLQHDEFTALSRELALDRFPSGPIAHVVVQR